LAVNNRGERFWLWPVVDSKVQDIVVQRRRDKQTALRLMGTLLKKHSYNPDVLVIDKLRFC